MLRVCEVTSAQRASRLLRLAVSRVRSADLSSDPSRPSDASRGSRPAVWHSYQAWHALESSDRQAIGIWTSS